MDTFVRAVPGDALAIAPSTIMLIAVVLCLLAVVVIILMKKRPSKAPGHSAGPLEGADHAAIASGVLAGLGGAENIAALDWCVTRLRVQVRDFTAVNEKAIKAAGASGIIRPDKNSCQVVLGPKAQSVHDELKKLL